jgi:hypothetical protein
MQSSPASCHFFPLSSKYSPQHPLLKHPSSLNRERSGFTPLQNNNKYSIVNFKLYVFGKKIRGRAYILNLKNAVSAI